MSTASAQRTQSGQASLRVSALYNGLSAGAEAFYEQYTQCGYWQAGLSGNLYHTELSSGGRMDFVHALAVGGYLFRLAGTRSRSLSLYAGGGVLTGVEALDPFTSLPGNIVLGRTKYSFLYGVCAQGALEWFVGRKLAVMLQASAPVTIGSAIGWMHWSIGLGLKLNL